MTTSTDPSYYKTRSIEEWKASRRDDPEDIAEAKKMLLLIKDGADVFKTIRKIRCQIGATYRNIHWYWPIMKW